MPDQQIVPIGGAMPVVPIGAAVPQGNAPPAASSGVTTADQPGWLSSAMDFASGVGSQINPVKILEGIYGAVTSPIETVKGIGASQLEQFKKGKQAYDDGRYSEALGHTLAGALPLVGPAAADIGEDIGQGHVAHGLGAATGLIGSVVAPSVVKPAVKALQGTSTASTIASAADRASTARMVDVVAPKVGANKVRFGTMAEQVAPKLAAEPGLGALSRSGLAEKVSSRLSEAEQALDAANDARNPAELIDTSLITSGLEEKLRKLTAMPAEGPDAHATAAKAGYGPAPPASAPLVSQKFSDLSPSHQAELKRIGAELKEFQFVDRTWIDTSNDIAREGGYGTGRGARNNAATIPDRPFAEGAAGAPVYHEILQGKSGTTRNAMIRAIDRYIDGDRTPSPVVQRALTIADARMRRPDLVSKPMLPLEDFLTPADGPLGKSVIPVHNQPQAQAITQALKEVRALGPMAPYDALRTIRQSWDQAARQKYVPSITQDFLAKSGEASGAADVTGVLRNVLSYADPVTAKANANYSLWRKADDVLQATQEIERTRPKVGRQIAARFAGGMVGEAAGGGLGAAIGVILGPVVDSVVNAGPTTKIMTARVLTGLSEALRSGDATKIETALKRARALGITAKAAAREPQ